jgi:hypothetical protein
MANTPTVLLIQPPVLDFTAFDLFVYPLGLLDAGATFEAAGFRAAFVDALDRYSPALAVPSLLAAPGDAAPLKRPTFRRDGCGHFPRQRVRPPAVLADVPRRFHRFGIPEDAFREALAAAPRPDVVAVSCAMTYWYLGVREAVDAARALFKETPVLLGGIYARLCPEHALETSGADFVFTGSIETGDVLGSDGSPHRGLDSLLEALGFAGLDRPGGNACSTAHHLVGARESAALRASTGCPHRCTYCAAPLLAGRYARRPVDAVVDELGFLIDRQGRHHVAFHDDTLVAGGPHGGFLELAAAIRDRGLHERAAFHCINGLNASAVTGDVARALRETNFKTLRLGFETVDAELQAGTGAKVSGDDLKAALANLRGAGFTARDVGVYVMAGLPGQETDTVAETIRFVHSLGAQARLTEYAPVPGTPAFREAKELSRLDLDEPLHHGKCLAPFRFETLTLDGLRGLKDLVRTLNDRLPDKTASRKVP